MECRFEYKAYSPRKRRKAAVAEDTRLSRTLEGVRESLARLEEHVEAQESTNTAYESSNSQPGQGATSFNIIKE